MIVEGYRKLLRDWVAYMRPSLFRPAPGLAYYGDGTDGWGVQTNQKAFSALAVLAAEDAQYRDDALAMLRYSLETHLTGSYHLTDGDDRRWGHTWISVLGVERMMHGVDALWETLTPEDQAALRRMLVSEADWLLESYPVLAGVVRDNRPESNLWNGALLVRTALLYPEEPNAAAWREKGVDFLVNSISVPSDAESRRVYEGKTVARRFVGANFTEVYGCNHHGYMNVGYMVITLSQIAMLHFSCRLHGWQPPEALYHHAYELWTFVKGCIYPDGRLLRIGGDTRIRYCYCQDYLLPVLHLAADLWGEDIDPWEQGWLHILQTEVENNGDGSFLSDRTELFRERSPLYYTRLESDRACVLAMSIFWRQQFDHFRHPETRCPAPDYTQWHDAFHGAFFQRDPGRYASFVWQGAEPPTLLCLPPSDSSLAEWQNNNTGFAWGDGTQHDNRVEAFDGALISGGFVTWGRYAAYTTGLLAEQISEEDILSVQIVCAALPDGATVLTFQKATAVKTCHVQKISGLHWQIPNDVYNHFTRQYELSGKTLTVDGKITLQALYGGEISMEKPAYRQIGLRHFTYPTRGMLHCDVVSLPWIPGPLWLQKGQVAYDMGAMFTCGKPASAVCELENGCRRVRVTGADGKLYTVYANLSETDQTIDGIFLPAGSGKVAADGKPLL